MAKKKVKWQPLFLVSLLVMMLVAATAALNRREFAGKHQLGVPKSAEKKVLPVRKNHTSADNNTNTASVTVQTESGDSVLPVQIGSLFDEKKTVYGINLGGIVQQQEINGFSLAAIHAFTRKKSGVSISFLDYCQNSYGVSISLGGGAVNNHGFALGVWNFAEYNHGVQVGLYNQAYPGAMLDSGMGDIGNVNNDIKISLSNGDKKNNSSDEVGFQFGLLNRSSGRGVQIGLWNINPNAWIPHFPLINFAF